MLLRWILLFWLFWCSLSLSPKVLSLVALDVASLRSCQRFLQTLDLTSFASIFVIYTDISPQPFSQLSSNNSDNKSTITYKHLPVKPLRATAISRHTFADEKVTAILQAMRFILPSGISDTDNKNRKGKSERRSRIYDHSHVLQIVFDQHTTSSIRTNGDKNDKTLDLLYSTSKQTDITLLSKTKTFNSLSDWRDLLLLSIHYNNNTRFWLSCFEKTFFTYAGGHLDMHGKPTRKVYTIHDPRFAIQEAIVTSQAQVSYWNRSVIDVDPSGSKDGSSSNSLIRVQCSSSDIYSDRELALVCHLHDPNDDDGSNNWRKEVHRNDAQIERDYVRKCNIPQEKYDNHPIAAQWCGIERFRYYSGAKDIATEHTRPRDFCWHTGSSPESPSRSRIYANYTTSKPLPTNLHDTWLNISSTMQWKSSKHKILFVSASGGTAKILEKKMYIALSKQYYAHRHEGYGSYFMLSTEVEGYIHPQTFETSNNPLARPMKDGKLGHSLLLLLLLVIWMMVILLVNILTLLPPTALLPHFCIPLGSSTYLRTIMSKTIMIASAMLSHPKFEWILWTDDDVYINTGYLSLPIEVYLYNVPPEKLFVSANYRSSFTNVMFIRNNAAGRALVYDWIAVSYSGK
jgi:hypothetical protein